MIRFDNNEFEIAIATYNRPEYIKGWLERCYNDICIRNIYISIYDSSTNSDTQKVVEEFNRDKIQKVEYHSVPSDTIIGYKPMIPIYNSTRKYLWVSGDSRYHDFNELDEKVFPFIKRNIDFILLWCLNNAENEGKVYTNKSDFLHDCFISSTCIGLSIYKLSLFDELKLNQDLIKEYDNLFMNNYGFAWLGYFYNEFAKGEHTAAFCKVAVKKVLNQKKKQSWT